MTNHGLNSEQLSLIKRILAPYSPPIERAGLFGSRATGTAKPNSDIDLVLYGPLDEAALARIRTLFNESLLPITVDVHAYGLIDYAPLKSHIDAVMQPLFDKEKL